MSSEFEVIGATVKVSGDAPLPNDASEYEHGDEVYVVARAAVNEVSFPEDKDGNVLRVHKAKLSQAFVVDGDDAEKLIAKERERVSGQGNLIAEIQRATSDVTEGEGTPSTEANTSAADGDDDEEKF